MNKDTNENSHRITCPICGHVIDKIHLQVHQTAEEWTLQQIRQDHPDWEESDGTCTKCWDYYISLSP